MAEDLTLPWLADLAVVLHAEFGGRPRVAALATADAGGRPQVRHVVIRHLDPDGSVWIGSDARSGKNRQLRERPEAELTIWLPENRLQYRLAGQVEVVGAAAADPRRLRLWIILSDAARGLFAWPPPGTPRDPESGFAAYPEAIPQGAPPPDSFELLVLRPERVERLDTSRVPHRRAEWGVSQGWAAVDLNP